MFFFFKLYISFVTNPEIPWSLECPLVRSKNKVLLQGHEKKYKFPNECDTTRRIKQNKQRTMEHTSFKEVPF